MNICFTVSQVESEAVGTTVHLIQKAYERNHTVYVMDVGGFNFHHNAPMSIDCKKLPINWKYDSIEAFYDKVKDESLKYTSVTSADIDVIFLRNNPTEETDDRRWAEHSAIAFSRMIQQEDVLVLNDAFALSHAYIDKLYFEELPAEIKPDSLITRNKEHIMNFYERVGRKMVLKPLEGSGGQNVYLIDENEKNINQIIETISNEGYVIAQEFLPEVDDGDVRVLLLNGNILKEDGKYAVIRRQSDDEEEFRSNLSLGGSADAEQLTPAMKHIVKVVAPKIKRDGLFFVGLDIVDDKLIEINVLSPGGLEVCEEIGLPLFTDTVIDAIECKIEYKSLYGNKLTNKELATME